MRTSLVVLALSIVLLASSGRSVPAQTTTQPRRTVLVLNGRISDVSIARLIAAVNGKVSEGATALTILLNSNGGDIDQAISAYNYLRGVPVMITTHNFGIVDSAALTIYCAGTKRLASPNARFVLHGITLTFQPVPINQTQLSEEMQKLQLQTNTMASIVARTTQQQMTAVIMAISNATVLTGEQAKDWGLVSDIDAHLYGRGDDVVIVPTQ